jgi:serine/threonine protein kinase
MRQRQDRRKTALPGANCRHQARSERSEEPDFGLVRRPLGMTTTPQTIAGESFGTWGFAAPESWDNAHIVTAAADVYSLGRVIAWAITNQNPIPNKLLLPESGPWRQFLEIVTADDAARRPQSMETFLSLLDQTFAAQPSATPSLEPLNRHVVIGVWGDDGMPVSGATIALLTPDSRHLDGVTDENGNAAIWVPERELCTVFCAHPNFAAHHQLGFDPLVDLTIRLSAHFQRGSLIILDGTGYIPGLKGRLNPILDGLNRTYLYAANIAIDGGMPHPVPFALGKPLQLKDALGVVKLATILDIRASTSLVEFQPI